MPPQTPAVLGARSIAGTDTPTTDHDGFKHLVTEDTEVTLTGTATGGWTPGRSALWYEVEDGVLSFVAGPGVTLRAASGDLAQDLASRFVVASYAKADVWTIEGTGPTFSAADRTKLDAIPTPATIETITGAQAKVDAAIANLVASAPGALDTLNELAAALGDDPNYAATTAALIAAAQTAADDAQGDIDTHTAATTGAHGMTAFGAGLVAEPNADDARVTLAAVGSTDVTSIVEISQTAYDALSPPDAGTLYLITS